MEYIPLVIGYILIAVLALWLVIKTRGLDLLKFAAITIVLAYGIIIFYIFPHFLGWPITQKPPDKSQIWSYLIVEPKSPEEGSVYFWILSFKETIPRSYRIPYDRELHKQLLEAQKEQKNEPGSYLLLQRGKKSDKKDAGDGSQPIDINIKAIFPRSVLTKEVLKILGND